MAWKPHKTTNENENEKWDFIVSEVRWNCRKMFCCIDFIAEKKYIWAIMHARNILIDAKAWAKRLQYFCLW